MGHYETAPVATVRHQRLLPRPPSKFSSTSRVARAPREVPMAFPDHFEMASVAVVKSGLPFVIWIVIDHTGKATRPSALVSLGGQLHRVSLRDPIRWLDEPPEPPEDATWKRIRRFVLRNRSLLLEHWRKQIATPEVLARLQAVPLDDAI